jgi:hypothetical protein
MNKKEDMLRKEVNQLKIEKSKLLREYQHSLQASERELGLIRDMAIDLLEKINPVAMQAVKQFASKGGNFNYQGRKGEPYAIFRETFLTNRILDIKERADKAEHDLLMFDRILLEEDEC